MSRNRLELCPESDPPTKRRSSNGNASSNSVREPLLSGDFLISPRPLPAAPPRSAWREAGPEPSELATPSPAVSSPLPIGTMRRTDADHEDLWPDDEKTLQSERPPAIASTSSSVTIQCLDQYQRFKARFAKIKDEWQLVILLGLMMLILSVGFLTYFFLIGKGYAVLTLRP